MDLLTHSCDIYGYTISSGRLGSKQRIRYEISSNVPCRIYPITGEERQYLVGITDEKVFGVFLKSGAFISISSQVGILTPIHASGIYKIIDYKIDSMNHHVEMKIASTKGENE